MNNGFTQGEMDRKGKRDRIGKKTTTWRSFEGHTNFSNSVQEIRPLWLDQLKPA